MLSHTHPEYVQFPDPNQLDDQGFLGHGANLEINTLLSAYQQGIFPWFNDNEPILWWSPNPRMILKTNEMNISRSLKKLIRSQRFNITCGTAFIDVIEQCSKPRSAHQLTDNNNLQLETDPQTWITNDMKDAYLRLHKAGYAQSIECWENSQLVGGLYGVTIAGMYFGESMFSKANNSSKVALANLCHFLSTQGTSWIDCQVESDHLVSLGAINMKRTVFLETIKAQLTSPNELNWVDFEKIKKNYESSL